MKCVSCGSEIAIGLQACPRCGAPRPQLPPKFRQIEQQYISLRQAYEGGRLSLPTFQAELSKIAIKDDHGVYWTLDTNGRWRRYNGRDWVTGDPPVEQASNTASSSKRKWGCVAAGCAAPVLVLAAVLAMVLVLGYEEYRKSPMLVEEIRPGELEGPFDMYTDDQLDVTMRLGSPESFTILFYQEDGQDGSKEETRYETWHYYTDGTEVSFLDGEILSEEPLDVPASEIVPMPYVPIMFKGSMNLDQVIAAAGLERYLVIPMEEAMMEDAQVYYANQLTFGLKGDELIFVESLALESE